MHNIEHERRPTNTPKPTSTLFNLSGLLRWVYCLKPHLFACVCMCVCADTKGSFQLYPIGVWQFWLLSNFMHRKWGGDIVIECIGQKWSRSTQKSTLRISNLLTEFLFGETCCLATLEPKRAGASRFFAPANEKTPVGQYNFNTMEYMCAEPEIRLLYSNELPQVTAEQVCTISFKGQLSVSLVRLHKFTV